MSLEFSKALVTGGAGFIGSHIVEALLQGECQVIVLDNLSSGRLRNLEAFKDRIDFVRGDIRDEKTLLRVTKGCEVVFHQAAVVSVTRTVEEPVSSAGVNELGTLQVLDTARKSNVRRVVLASSSAVYGDDPILPKTEAMPPQPLSPYAVQKLTNEQYALLYHRCYGLQTCCLRYFNVFGPRQDPSSPYSGVISIFMTRAARNQKPVIYGDGKQTRDFIFVRDVVQANLLAAEKEAAVGHVFNVGTSRSIEIRTLWDMVADLAQCRMSPRHAKARSGDIVHSVSDIGKARQLLGFRPSVSFEEGLRRTLAWYKGAA